MKVRLLSIDRSRELAEPNSRQMNQGKAKTSKQDVCYRLLIGLALLLRQAWVWLTTVVARDRNLRPSQLVAELPLARLTAWIAESLQAIYKDEKMIHLASPLPPLDPAFLRND